MSIVKTLLGNTRLVAETGETGWGAETTQILVDLIDIAAVSAQALAGGNIVVALPATTATPAAAATVTPTSNNMLIEGSGGPVTLSATTPIAAGEFSGQALRLEGTDATNTVTILDSGNVGLNGPITLGDGTVIEMSWNSTKTQWIEDSRNS